MKADVSNSSPEESALLQAVWADAAVATVPGLAGVGPNGEGLARGLAAYRANAQAAAARALSARYPTVAQLMGEASMAALAWAFWRRHPPRSGDLACWGDELPAFMAADPNLADFPYLPDCARLDDLISQAETASDPVVDATSLQRLADSDPGAITLCLAPGTGLVASPHPIVAIWQAHQTLPDPDGDRGDLGEPHTAERFAQVQAAWQSGHAAVALVWRQGWQVKVRAWSGSPASTACLQALRAGASLAQALDAADAAGPFDFSDWLGLGLRDGWLVGVRPWTAVSTTER